MLVARRQNLLEEVADIARYYGSPNVITIKADVSKFEDCRRVINETMNHFRRCKSINFPNFNLDNQKQSSFLPMIL